MPNETISVRAYSVKQCGLYKLHARRATLGDFEGVLGNVTNWVNAAGRLVNNTCTYSVDSDSSLEFLETYIMRALRHDQTGDYFITCWNRTHQSGDSVYGLDPAATTAAQSVANFHSSNMPNNAIPGYATYFWMVPSRNLMLTITFGTPRNGMQAFSYWLERFISTRSRYVKRNGVEIIGHAGEDDVVHPDLVARFKKNLKVNPSKVDLIRRNREHIRAMVRKIRLNRADVEERSTIFKMIGMRNQVVQTTVDLAYQVNHTPTEEELNEIIASYEAEHGSNAWEDVGFVFPQSNNFGAERKEWLGKSYAKLKFDIDVDWLLAGELVNTDHFAARLVERRNHILSIIHD